MKGRTCEGCEKLCIQPAGKKEGVEHVFFICRLGKFDRCLKSVIEHAPASRLTPSVERPAWCKLALGYAMGAPVCDACGEFE